MYIHLLHTSRNAYVNVLSISDNNYVFVVCTSDTGLGSKFLDVSNQIIFVLTVQLTLDKSLIKLTHLRRKKQ